MICGYCEEEIAEGESYIYKWFPDQKKMLAVHAYHLKTGGVTDGSG